MEDRISKLIELAQGNPGAATFLAQLSDDHQSIITKIRECPTLRGTNLWVLFSDLCGKDFDKVKTLCENCPNETLEDACSRQDYSGIGIVSKYFEPVKS